MLRTVFAMLIGLMLLGSTRAENSLIGTWEDKEKGLKIIFTDDAQRGVTAKLMKGNTTFEFDGYSLQESNGQATMTGQFTDGKGGSYPFNAEASNGEMTFRTGKAEYHLKKQGAAPAPAPKNDNPLDDSNPSPAPKPKNPMDDDAPPAKNNNNGGVYRHASGLWSLQSPGAGWTKEETPDGNTVKWTHSNGGLIFVTIMPECPFDLSQDFFERALGPGLQQNGAQIVQKGPIDDPGVPSFCGTFTRTRNNVAEFGTCLCSCTDGKGLIFQISIPQDKKDAMAPEIRPIFGSFKVNK